mmetsp:Transcript_12821/g.37634  ORF Transcript_12821/g.37634 Transcript_12821/m.37634 type:complete len:498 (+) Transcript_12821:1172-2665(+)
MVRTDKEGGQYERVANADDDECKDCHRVDLRRILVRCAVESRVPRHGPGSIRLLQARKGSQVDRGGVHVQNRPKLQCGVDDFARLVNEQCLLGLESAAARHDDGAAHEHPRGEGDSEQIGQRHLHAPRLGESESKQAPGAEHADLDVEHVRTQHEVVERAWPLHLDGVEDAEQLQEENYRLEGDACGDGGAQAARTAVNVRVHVKDGREQDENCDGKACSHLASSQALGAGAIGAAGVARFAVGAHGPRICVAAHVHISTRAGFFAGAEQHADRLGRGRVVAGGGLWDDGPRLAIADTDGARWTRQALVTRLTVEARVAHAILLLVGALACKKGALRVPGWQRVERVCGARFARALRRRVLVRRGVAFQTLPALIRERARRAGHAFAKASSRRHVSASALLARISDHLLPHGAHGRFVKARMREGARNDLLRVGHAGQPQGRHGGGHGWRGQHPLSHIQRERGPVARQVGFRAALQLAGVGLVHHNGVRHRDGPARG